MFAGSRVLTHLPTRAVAAIASLPVDEPCEELHLDGITITGRADVLLDNEGGVTTGLAIVDYPLPQPGWWACSWSVMAAISPRVRSASGIAPMLSNLVSAELSSARAASGSPCARRIWPSVVVTRAE
jgi:hypothetical protein